MSLEHDEVQLLHEDMLKRLSEDVKGLETEIYGIPQRLDSMEQGMNRLCETVVQFGKDISGLLRRIEDKYQTKEMCDMCNVYLKKEMEDIKRENERQRKEIENLKDDNKNKDRKMLYAGALFLIQLVAWIFLNHDKLLK